RPLANCSSNWASLRSLVACASTSLRSSRTNGSSCAPFIDGVLPKRPAIFLLSPAGLVGTVFQKVAAIPEQTRFLALADQAQPGLVDQGGGLGRMPGFPWASFWAASCAARRRPAATGCPRQPVRPAEARVGLIDECC